MCLSGKNGIFVYTQAFDALRINRKNPITACVYLISCSSCSSRLEEEIR